jgi:hypothetical protein
LQEQLRIGLNQIARRSGRNCDRRTW